VSDSHFTPHLFKGSVTDNENVKEWLHYFDNYVQFRGIEGDSRLQLFKLLLQNGAAEWLRTLPAVDISSFDNVLAAFRHRYVVTDVQRWQKAITLWTHQQQPDESVDSHFTDILKLCRAVPITDQEQIRFAAIKGLRGEIKLHVLQSGARTVDEALKAAGVAEAALAASANTTQVADLTKQLKTLITQLQVPRSPAVNVVTPPGSRTASPRRVRFNDGPSESTSPAIRRRDMDERTPVRGDSQSNSMGERRVAYSNFEQQSGRRDINDMGRWRPHGSNDNPSRRCGNCNAHIFGRHTCAASGRRCYNCGKLNHFSRCCHSAQQNLPPRGHVRPIYPEQNWRPGNFYQQH